MIASVRFHVVNKLIPSTVVCILSSDVYVVPNREKKLYNISGAIVSFAKLLTTLNNHKKIGICINIIIQPLRGQVPSFLNNFIVSSDNFSGSSLYFS
jgi:hypothetical protein